MKTLTRVIHSKYKTTGAHGQVIPDGVRNNANLSFSNKENKKCLFPTLKIGSVANSTLKSISKETHGFLQEEN